MYWNMLYDLSFDSSGWGHSFYIGLVRYGSIGGEIYSLHIIPYSLMAYSRPQSIYTHLYMNRSLHRVCMEAYSKAQKHVKLLL